MVQNGETNILVTRSSLPDFDEYVEEIRPVFESHWLTNMGQKHQQLEAQLRDYLGAEHVSLFANGHLALECCLQALGLEGEVITTPFTFISTTNAIVRSGLSPVFCDVKPDDLTLDPARIEEKITDRTCAIVPVHVYGSVCDVEAIERIARTHDLKLVYDAAHAFGVTVDGRPVGTFGDASMFSFHATKVFHTVEGGAVVTEDGALCERLALMKNFGITGPEEAVAAGGNAKLNEFSAAMGICNLRHIDDYIAARGRAVARYRERLGDVPGLRLIEPQPGVTPNHAYFPVLFEDEFGASRDDVFAALEQAGIGSRKYFFPLVSDFVCYRDTYDAAQTPVARDAAARVLTLPLYSDLELATVDAICDCVLGCRR